MIRFSSAEFGELEFYELRDLIDEDFVFTAKTYVKGKKLYYNDYFTFDIETTTVGTRGFMYCAMFYINGKPIMTRTWEEVKKIINRIQRANDYTVVCYVHNLSFEFQFMKDFFRWSSVFATDRHKVLKATTANIEFRCSYMLTNKSLYKFLKDSKNAVHYKQGDFDYNKLRTPKTEQNDTELLYEYCDVVGLYEGIQDFMEEHNMANIPLTSTGFVREDCKKAIKRNPKNRKWLENTRIDSNIYKLLKEELRGGNTHGSHKYVGMRVENVRSRDERSAYPYVMLTKEYPSSEFMKVRVDNEDDLIDYMKNYACLFRVYLSDVKLKESVNIPYISISKLINHTPDIISFNGRLISSSIIGITCNEIDFKIIQSQYDFEIEGITDFYIAEKAMLPEELRGVILDYFMKKTALKGKDEYEYMKSKNKLNAIFGMACTDIVRDNFTFKDGVIEKTKPDIDETVEKYENGKTRFLPYPIGAWVTAYARQHLQIMLDITGENTIYCDTDSDKYISTPEIEEALEKENLKIIEECKRTGAYIEYNGKEYYLGIYEDEGVYEEFKTLGAKRYCFMKGGEFGITCSGVSKAIGADEIVELSRKKKTSPMDIFSDGLILKKATKNCIYYNDEQVHKESIGDERFSSASNCGIVKEENYTLSLTDSMKAFIFEFDEREVS